MKIKFLNTLYDKRSIIKQEIAELEKRNNYPRSQCCSNMSSDDSIRTTLALKRLELISIEEIIESYLDTAKS